jgi:hypothetical protein
LRYTENENTLWISARYDGGLETSYDLRNKWVDALVLRIIAESPMWTEDNQEVDVLEFEQTLDDTDAIVGRIDGEWDRMYAVDGEAPGGDGLNRIRIGPDGTVYFADDGGVVRYWDGTDWEELFRMDGAINDLAIDSEGGIYIVGAFDDVLGGPGNTYRRIAYWDGAALSAVGTGWNGDIFCIEFWRCIQHYWRRGYCVKRYCYVERDQQHMECHRC